MDYRPYIDLKLREPIYSQSRVAAKLSIIGKDLSNKPGIQILSDFDSMTVFIENHNPQVIVVVWFAVVLGSFALEFDVCFTANHLRTISPFKAQKMVGNIWKRQKKEVRTVGRCY